MRFLIWFLVKVTDKIKRENIINKLFFGFRHFKLMHK